MSKLRKFQSLRGFTLVEMLVVVTIVGLVLSMIGLEFSGVVSQTLHTRANTDAESQARLIITKVTNEMHAAFPDITDCKSFPDPLCGSPYGQMVVPQPASTPGPIADFYRVHQGALVGAIPPCSYDAKAPCPQYDRVTIALNALVPGELDETVQPALGGPGTTTVIGNNVTSFVVSPDLTQSNSDYSIQITVSIPSSHCTSNFCTYTLNNIVYVGGLGTE